MREIKFRAWDKHTKMMNEITHLRLPDRGDLMFAVSLMQYTGIKDANEKEIYEGDILIHDVARAKIQKHLRGPWVVFWNHHLMSFEAGKGFDKSDGEYNEKSGGFDSEEVPRYWRIVGNIYQNPELLN